MWRTGKWVALAAWLVVAIVGVTLAAKVGSVQDNDEKNWLPANAESTRALELARGEFHTGDTMPLTIVYTRAGALGAADRAAAEVDRVSLAGLAAGTLPAVAASADGQALLVSVPLPAGDATNGSLTAVVDRASATVADGLPAGLTATLTGPAASRADATVANTSLDASFLLTTVATVALLLLLIYRSPMLPLIALLAVGLAAVLANAVIYLLGAHAGLVVTGSDATLLTVLIFGAGTDYALLLIARYREELRRNADRHEAMGHALRRTFPTVLASSATVVLAVLCLLVADLNSTRGLGPVAAIGIASAFLVMTTLLPALLVAFGRGLFWPFVPRFEPGHARDDTVADHGRWDRVATAVGHRPRLVWAATALALVAVALGTVTLRVGGLTAGDNFTRTPESVRGQRLLAQHFPAGSGTPVDIYARVAVAGAVAEAARATPGVAGVRPADSSRSGEWVHIPAVLTDNPTSRAAQQTVTRLRDRLDRVAGARALVGGDAAASLDQADTMNRDLRLIIPLVLAVVLGVLVALLRAVLAPLLLLGCVVLSFGASLGAASLIFRALGHPRTDPALLLIGFLFLIALGVDYTIFLVSRVREDAARYGHRRGVLHGLAVTGGVITGAGLVLAATFSVLTVTPVVLNLQIGILVAVGVLLDTFVVRTLLVPALALDAGPRIWWPGGRPPG